MKRVRPLWVVRAACLGLITSLAASACAWGAQRHHGQIVFEGAAIAVLALAVMALNFKLND